MDKRIKQFQYLDSPSEGESDKVFIQYQSEQAIPLKLSGPTLTVPRRFEPINAVQTKRPEAGTGMLKSEAVKVKSWGPNRFIFKDSEEE